MPSRKLTGGNMVWESGPKGGRAHTSYTRYELKNGTTRLSVEVASGGTVTFDSKLGIVGQRWSQVEPILRSKGWSIECLSWDTKNGRSHPWKRGGPRRVSRRSDEDTE